VVVTTPKRYAVRWTTESGEGARSEWTEDAAEAFRLLGELIQTPGHINPAIIRQQLPDPFVYARSEGES
jgi:hypothetical protein